MNVKTALAGILNTKETKSTSGENWVTVGGIENELTKLSDKSLLNTYRGWVYAAVNAIAEEVANIEFKLLKKNKKNVKEIEKHPILDILRTPNNFFSKFDFFFGIETYLLLLGRAFVYIEKAGNNPSRLWLLNSAEITVKLDDKGFPIKYVNTSTNQTFDVDEIIEFRKFSPFNLFDGYSPMQAGAYIYDMIEGLDNWGVGLYQTNGGIPPFALVFKNKISKEEMTRYREQFIKEYTGKKNAFKVLFLSGDVDIVKIGLTPKDMDISKLRVAIRDEILGIFRVPKIVVGLTEDVNRASAFVSDYVFARRVVKIEMRRIVDALNLRLAPHYGLSDDTYLWFKNPEPRDAKEDAEIKNMQIAGKGWKTINEIRAEEGLSELPDGDKLPYEYMNNLKNQETKALETQFKKIKLKISKIDEPQKRKLKIAKSFENKSNVREAMFKKKIKEYTVGLEKRVLDKINGVKTFKVKKAFDSVIDVDQEVKALVDLFSELYEYMVEEGMQDALELLDGGNITITDIIRRDTTGFLQDFALNVTDTTKKELLETIENGLNDGDTLEQLAKRVKDVMKNIRTTRAETIATTETNKLVNYGRLATYQQNGISKKEWLAVGDHRTRDWHLEADGQTVPINSHFKVKGELLQYPGDSNASAENVINCRCGILPIFE